MRNRCRPNMPGGWPDCVNHMWPRLWLSCTATSIAAGRWTSSAARSACLVRPWPIGFSGSSARRPCNTWRVVVCSLPPKSSAARAPRSRRLPKPSATTPRPLFPAPSRKRSAPRPAPGAAAEPRHSSPFRRFEQEIRRLRHSIRTVPHLSGAHARQPALVKCPVFRPCAVAAIGGFRAMSPTSSLFAPAAVLVAGLLVAGCEAKTEAAPQAARPVQIERVHYTARTAAREFVGVVRARHEPDLGFRVGGKILRRHVNVGDGVHAGQVLAELDGDDLRLQVACAEAELTAAQANLEQVSADFDRYATLKERGFASAAEYDRKSAAKGEAEGRRVRAALPLPPVSYTQHRAHETRQE